MLGKPFSWIIFLSLLKSSIWSSWSQWKRANSSLFTCWRENQRYSYSHLKTRTEWGRHPFSLYRVTETPTDIKQTPLLNEHPLATEWTLNEYHGEIPSYRINELARVSWPPSGKKISIDMPSYPRNEPCKGTVSHRIYEFVRISPPHAKMTVVGESNIHGLKKGKPTCKDFILLDRFSTCCLRDFCSAIDTIFSCVSLSSISWALYRTWSNSCFCVCSFAWYWLIASCSCSFSCCSLLIWTRRALSSLLWLSCSSLTLFSN